MSFELSRWRKGRVSSGMCDNEARDGGFNYAFGSRWIVVVMWWWW